jgi:hypothetical protein
VDGTTDTRDAPPRQKRGRPSKFGRASRLVALTLPEDVIRGLRRVHPDLAWAVVSLFEKRAPIPQAHLHADAELVNIGERESLIVISRAAFKELPGVDITPLDDERAFLALDPGCGIGDLEQAVVHRLGSPAIGEDERRTLRGFRRRLQGWRRNRDLRIYTRAIIVIDRVRDQSTIANQTMAKQAIGKQHARSGARRTARDGGSRQGAGRET